MSDFEGYPQQFTPTYGGGMPIPEPGSRLVDGSNEHTAYVGLEFGRVIDPRMVQALGRLLKISLHSSGSTMYISPAAPKEELLLVGSLINQKSTEKRMREMRSEARVPENPCNTDCMAV
jgi:hypothetical protein